MAGALTQMLGRATAGGGGGGGGGTARQFVGTNGTAVSATGSKQYVTPSGQAVSET